MPDCATPDWAPHVRSRLASLRLTPTREAEIILELSQHLDDRWRELVAGGASPDDATRAALAEFREGNLLARYLAPLRQANMPPPILPAPTGSGLGDLWRDVRYAARLLRRQPASTMAAVVTLALAIGATTAIFTIVDTVLLRALPFPEADRLVQVARLYRSSGFSESVSQPKFHHWRREGRQVFAEIAAYGDLGSGFSLVGDGAPERLIGSYVSAGFFDVMGVPPALGRAFRHEEDVPGAARVVVLSHALWKDRLGARTDILGRALTLNGEPYTVIGVMPADFRYPDVAQLWTLFRFDPASRDRAHNFKVAARLRADVTLDRARAAMAVAGDAIRQATGDLMGDEESIGVRPLREDLYGSSLRRALLILLGAVGFVLLIACVNVANLQLAQAAERRQELALRTALGARTGTIVRQLLVETTLLSVVGGLAGIAVAYVAVPLLLAFSPEPVPFADRIAVDWRVLAAAFGVSFAAGLGSGLLPAWQSARPQLEDMLRAGGHRVSGRGNRWTRRALVAGEVALALVLTIGAFLLVKSLVRLQATNPGLAVEQVLTMKVALPEAKYGTGAALAQFEERVEASVGAVPGVRAAALTHILPMQLASDLPFTIEGRYVPGTQTGVGDGQFRPISPRYFETLEIAVRRGRAFDARDRRSALPVVIINEAAARRFWPKEDPIGRRIHIGPPYIPDLGDPGPREIIGVVDNVREEGLDAEAPPIVYVPIAQLNEAYAALGTRLLPYALIVRGEAGAANLTRSVQEAIWSVDPQQPISDVMLMREIVARSLGSLGFNTALLSGLAGLALVLAAVGLYGVVAHAVTQHTREIGIRMALGATRTSVVSLFLRQAVLMVLVGIVVGLIGAFSVTRVLRTLLSGLSPSDPWVFALAPALMLVVAIVAALRPALRAASVDPVRAIRAD